MNRREDSRLPDISEYLRDKSRRGHSEDNETSGRGLVLHRNHVDLAERAKRASEIAQMRHDYLLSPASVRENKIISSSNVNEPAANAFRELRRSVFHFTEKPDPIVMVTGVAGDVGSTFVARNLAAAIALEEVSTALYVDCNIRNAQQSQDDGRYGLTDYLESKDVSEDEIIQQTGILRLRKIGAGRSRELPGEYFSSSRLRYLFQNISTRYPDRSVIIDGPPVSTDTAILADLCDAVLLVLAFGRSTEQQVANALSVLGPEKIMGCVFNDQPLVPEFQW